MKFLIKCITNWKGYDAEYVIKANSKKDIYDLAEDLARDNFESYDFSEEILCDYLDNSEELSIEELNDFWELFDSSECYDWDISEINEEDWNYYISKGCLIK